MTTFEEYSAMVAEMLPDLKPRRRLNLIEDMFGRAVSQAKETLYPDQRVDFVEQEKLDKIGFKADEIVRDIISDPLKLEAAVKHFEIHEPSYNNLRNTLADLEREDRQNQKRGR